MGEVALTIIIVVAMILSAPIWVPLVGLVAVLAFALVGAVIAGVVLLILMLCGFKLKDLKP